MENQITILAPAKINIFLNVLGKREDGFYDIESVMQTIGIFDRINVIKKEPSDISEQTIDVYCDGGIPGGEQNIAYSAAKEFFSYAGIKSYNAELRISKRIPAMAGLGGGSSDAASALIALNELYETGIDTESLCGIGALVGSDVPFCVKKGTCVAQGRGEKIESCTPMPDCVIVVAFSGENRISTPEAYSKIDNTYVTASLEEMKSALADCSVDKIGEKMFNKFEYILPEDSGILNIKKKLISLGASASMMSGSGSAVFALFEDVHTAKSAAEALIGEAETFVCRPVRRSYAFIET